MATLRPACAAAAGRRSTHRMMLLKRLVRPALQGQTQGVGRLLSERHEPEPFHGGDTEEQGACMMMTKMGQLMAHDSVELPVLEGPDDRRREDYVRLNRGAPLQRMVVKAAPRLDARLQEWTGPNLAVRRSAWLVRTLETTLCDAARKTESAKRVATAVKGAAPPKG